MKKLVTVILIYIFYFNSISTAYAANVGGWNLSNAVAQGASTVYDASKNVVINGKNYVKDSWVKITPTASQVSKVLARGAAGYALSVAVEQLLGSVDWVLDPANNQIVYTKPSDPNDPDDPAYGQYLYNLGFGRFPSPEAACRHFSSVYEGVEYVSANHNGCTTRQKRANGETYLYTYQYSERVLNPAYNPPSDQEDNKRTLPLDTVSKQVISNAENDDTNAQVATTAAAADIVAEAETDQSKARPIASQAEANAETKPADEAAAESANEATGSSKPNTANPEAMDLSLEFPVFCNWAPTICEAAQVVISFPQTLTGWWETANSKVEQWVNSISEAWQQVRDYFKEEAPPNDSTEVEFVEPVPPVVDAPSFTWNAYCPFSARTDQISVDGNTVSLESDLTSWCEMAVEVRPFILFAGAWISYLIISGFRMGGD